jgi:alkylation response protein AidB-like acyl-CoA dehydrogenase
MDLNDSPREAAFRAECRAWLQAHAAPRTASSMLTDMLSDEADTPDKVAEAQAWQKTKHAAGWGAITWPPEFGGRGGTPMEQIIFDQEEARCEVPTRVLEIGLGLAGPTLLAHGTPEQKARWLLPLVQGTEIWCQLFSEPDAGSDLAGLKTRAVADDGGWLVSGQKVWTSGAHHADWGMLLARTDPEVPKTRGLTYFVLDMHSPGVEVVPLRQITGGSHFTEVFFDQVRVLPDQVLGAVNGGWAVARTTLFSERAMVGRMLGNQGLGAYILDIAATSRGEAARDDLAALYTLASVIRYSGYRTLAAISQTGIPGPEAITLKLQLGELFARTARLALDLEGAAGMGQDRWAQMLLSAPALRLGGGTDEIVKNLIGEMVLGLPREPSVDHNVPFRELKVGTLR